MNMEEAGTGSSSKRRATQQHNSVLAAPDLMPSGQQQQVFHKEFQKFVINSKLPPISVLKITGHT
jgi:hypothetical protein